MCGCQVAAAAGTDSGAPHSDWVVHCRSIAWPSGSSCLSPSAAKTVANTLDLARRLPNNELVIYPDAGHAGIFQFNEQFVEKALEFLTK